MSVTNCNAKRAIRRNAAAGFHYFEPATMDAFGSIVHKAYEGRDGTYWVVMSNRWGIDDDATAFRYHVVVTVQLDGLAAVDAGHLVMDREVPIRSTAWTFTNADNYARARAAQ